MADVDLREHLGIDQEMSAEKLAGVIDRLEDELGQPIACRGCNEIADPPHVTVLAYPRPWADDDDLLLCQQCWAEEAAEQTDLTERKAEIGALKIADFSNAEIARAIGRATGTVSSTLSGLKTRDAEIDNEICELERTRDLLGHIIWRRG